MTSPRTTRRNCRMRRLIATTVAGAVAAACLAFEAQAARLAMVVGNDNYTSVTKLRNARNDANSLGRELEAAGFTVTRVLDATRDSLNDQLDGFLGRFWFLRRLGDSSLG